MTSVQGEAVRREDVQASLERLRSGTFDLLEMLRREPPSEELAEVMVALQSVANRLGRIEALGAGQEETAL